MKKPIATIHYLQGGHKAYYTQQELDYGVTVLKTMKVPFFVCLHGKDAVDPLTRHHSPEKPPQGA